MASSVDEQEIRNFEAMAQQWWDPNGSFKPLHSMNRARIRYIREQIIHHLCPQKADHMLPLEDIKLLDIGCGGGLLSESLARLGGQVTAVDASNINIDIAKHHAEQSNLVIDYRTSTAEELYQNDNPSFDVICCLEVIEHVADIHLLLESCARMLRADGLFFISTLNRTIRAFIMAIVGAEYILRWLPRGTHDWNKFLKPDEIADILRNFDIQILDLSGMSYQILQDQWKISSDTAVNYIMIGQKK